MDPWINSLVQSPLVRSLSTVPSRMSSFAYGVRDNVPPFSFAKEVINQTTGSYGWESDVLTVGEMNADKTFLFNIPESGLLDRMYLRVRMIGKTQVTRDPLMPIEAGAAGARTALRLEKQAFDAKSSSMNFASLLETATLRTTGNKDIEVLNPVAIASHVQKLPSAQRRFWMQCLNGFAAGKSGDAITPFTVLYNPYAEISDASDDYPGDRGSDAHQCADFLIPLPFSLLSQLKDNLQTRFVDNLTLSVKMRKDDAMFSEVGTGNNGYLMSLVCIFHNFHDVIENSIRDQNFKRGFPASIYSHNYVYGESQISASGKKLTHRITSRHLVSEMYCVLRYNDATTAHPRYALPSVLDNVGPFKFTLYGSGRQLWQAYSWELSGPDVADYQLADAHAYGEDLTKSTKAEIVQYQGTDPSLITDSITNSGVICDRITLGFPHLYSLRFGFQANDNFYTGGIALQTISNPTLEIESLGTTATPWAATANSFTMDLVLKTCNMIRIDSDTGVITTSLDV